MLLVFILCSIVFLGTVGGIQFHHETSNLTYEVAEINHHGWSRGQQKVTEEGHADSHLRRHHHHRTLVGNEEDTSPRPHSPYNKVLGLICAYNYGHIDPLTLIFNEYLYMCEGGWDATVVLFTTEVWSEKTKRLYANKMFCYRTNSTVEIRHEVFPKTINVALAAEHRHYMAKVIDQYDLYVYHEDDIIMRYNQVVAFAQETRRMKEIGLSFKDNIIGFQRYRRLNKGGDHQKGGWGEQDIVEQEMLEETPILNQVCLGDKIKDETKKVPYMYVTGNTHTGAYMMTKEQIMILQDKCLFLNQSSPSREYMSSFSLFDHKQYHCGLSKLIPAERLMTFEILHYFPQRMVSWYPTFLADQAVRVGGDYRSASRHQLPPCWKAIYDAAIADEEAEKAEKAEKERIHEEEKKKKEKERLKKEQEAEEKKKKKKEEEEEAEKEKEKKGEEAAIASE